MRFTNGRKPITVSKFYQGVLHKMYKKEDKKSNRKRIFKEGGLNWQKIVLSGKVLWTVISFSLNYGIVERETVERNFEKIYSFLPDISVFFNGIDAQPLTTLFLLWFFVKYYKSSDAGIGYGKKRFTVEMLTLIASTSLFTGTAIYKYESLDILFLGKIQCVKSFIIVGGYYLFFQKLFTIMTNEYDKLMNNRKTCFSIHFFEKKYVGLLVFITLLVLWGGTLFVYYPAMFMGDTEDILYMAFNYPTGLTDSVLLPRKGVYLTNHHPVLYTGFVRIIMDIVRKFGGGDIYSIFICAIVQCVVSAGILSYSCIYCARELKKPCVATFALIFWAICPWISKYAIMISKDTLFAGFILLFGVNLHGLLNSAKKTKYSFGVLLPALMVLLLRKNGLYIVQFTFIFLLFLYRKYWKQWFVYIVLIILIQFGFSNIILPAAGIADGSVREALSIPFQQTARYIQKYGDEVTEQEREAVNAVLRYDVLAKIYLSDVSDPVKDTFRIDADNKDLINYFKVWFAMFWKHPGTYVAATMSNYYGYFYPIVNDVQKLYRTSVGSMYNAGRDGYFEFSNVYDEVHVWLRDLCSLYDMIWMKTPVINILMTSAFYVWVVLTGWLMKLGRGDKCGFAFMLVFGLTTLTALAGPCNAIDYERYIYPLILGFPIILGVLFYEE